MTATVVEFSDGEAVPVGDPSGVHGAVAASVGAANRVGLPDQDRAAVSLVATELSSNLARHAYEGVLVVNAVHGRDTAAVQLLAVDRGPGIPDPRRALQDGFSTTGTLGSGLGACRRVADEFDLHSSVGEGTVVLARIGPGARLTRPVPGAPVRVGGLLVPHPRERVSGDGWRLLIAPDVLTVAVVDGLGHGPGAATARHHALAAVDRPLAPLEALDQAERALRGTRGAVVSMVRLDLPDLRLEYAGVGNVNSVLVAGGQVRALIPKPGIVGVDQPHHHLPAQQAPWTPGSVLVLHTDGLHAHWDLADHPGLAGQHPAVVAGVLWRSAQRGTDDTAVCVLVHSPGAP